MNSFFSKGKDANNLHTIAFYNLENLFNTSDDKHVLDRDFTPNGKKKWTKARYRKKLEKLSTTISKIGRDTANKPPTMVGIVEVENKEVIEDLLTSKGLKDYDYGFVHFNSPDERGIDTAFLYLKSNFIVLESEPIPLLLYNDSGERDTTRDILYVRGELNKEEVHVFVNHWPSRRTGVEETLSKRMMAAEVVLKKMTSIEKVFSDPKYIIMGDFNDNPQAKSIQHLLASKPLHNPMIELLKNGRGSANYKGVWSLFDQIIVSQNVLELSSNKLKFLGAEIYDNYNLKEWKGKFSGNPFRTYVGTKYLGGVSDHFPVFVQLSQRD